MPPSASIPRSVALLLFLAAATAVAQPTQPGIRLRFGSAGKFVVILTHRGWQLPDGELRTPGERLGCRFEKAGENYHRGRCEPSDRIGLARYRRSVDLDPLFSAFSAAGAERVRVTLTFPARGSRLPHPPSGYAPIDDYPGRAFVKVAPVGVQQEPFTVSYGPDALFLWSFGAPVLLVWLLAVALALRIRRKAIAASDAERSAVWLLWTRTHLVLLLAASVLLITTGVGRVSAVADALGFPSWANSICAILIPASLAVGMDALFLALSRDAIAALRGVQWTRRRLASQTFWCHGQIIVPLALALGALSAFTMSVAGSEEDRAAGICLASAVLFYVIASQQASRSLGFNLQALTTGPLRDRAYELASLAGIQLRQLYLIPAGSLLSANAFATLGNNVVLSDEVVRGLDRRQLDTVLAHEIAHLKGRHPLLHAVALVAPIALALSLWQWIPNQFAVENLSAVAVLAGLLVSLLLLRLIERRADASGVALTGDPEATVTALARLHRLNGIPTNWSQLDAKIFSHPSAADRAGEIAQEVGLPPERVLELLEQPPEPGAPYPLPPGRESRVLSTAFRVSVLRRMLWIVLATSTIPPSAAALAIEHGAGPWWLIAAAGLAVAVALGRVVSMWSAHRSLARLEPSLRESLRTPPGDVAGIAPGARPRYYNSFYFWDAGCLDISGPWLTFVGEETRFSLHAREVSAVRWGPPQLRWLAPKVITIDWRTGENGGSLRLDYLAAASPEGGGPYRTELFQRLENWRHHHQAAVPLERPEPPPAFGNVTSLSPRKSGTLAATILGWFLVGTISLGCAALLDYPAGPYIPLAACAVDLIQRLPTIVYRESR